jgi:hypothetical protein
VDLADLGSVSETCVGSRVRLVGVFISFEKNFYRVPFTPPSLVLRIGPSMRTVPHLNRTGPHNYLNRTKEEGEGTTGCRRRARFGGFDTQEGIPCLVRGK